MKRFQSAFAVPSGFAVATAAKSGAKAARRGETGSRAGDHLSGAGVPPKRPVRDVRDRAA